MDSFDERILKDAKTDLKRRQEALAKKSKRLDAMIKKDVVDEKKLKQDLNYLLDENVISNEEIKELRKMRPIEVQKLVDRLVLMPSDLSDLEGLNVISPIESEAIKTLPISEKLKWLNILKTAYLQQNQGWLEADFLANLRREIGWSTDRIEKYLSANSEVKSLIKKMEKTNELSKEEVKKYWEMNPILALQEIKAQKATQKTLEEMEKIFGK